MEGKIMLEIRNLNKSFRKKSAVENLSLSLGSGVYGLLGPNGAGKTTLIRCITGLYSFDGEINYKEKSIKGNDLYMSKIGYLPQKFGSYRELTVEENLQYFCVLKDIPKNLYQKEIAHVLEMVNMTDERNKKAKALSGGMTRRLGIAQALLGDPDIMIFDEPTAGLDPGERLKFKMIISSLPKDRLILISTHIVEDVDALCSGIIIMKDGRIKFNGSTGRLKSLAEGKVFECSSVQLDKTKGSCYIQRQFEQDGEIKYRILSDTNQPCDTAAARIEDGYICVLEEI